MKCKNQDGILEYLTDLPYYIRAMKLILLILKSWLPLAVGLTAVCFLLYATVQQTYRQNANDPQTEIVLSVESALDAGRPAASFNNPNKPDLAKILSPFIILFDDSGKPIAGTVILAGKIPEPPKGVFNYAQKNGENRFTWEPQNGVREAVVLRKVKSGFILAGRSLKEIEKRVDLLSHMVLFGWAVALGGSLMATVAVNLFFPAKNK